MSTWEELILELGHGAQRVDLHDATGIPYDIPPAKRQAYCRRIVQHLGESSSRIEISLGCKFLQTMSVQEQRQLYREFFNHPNRIKKINFGEPDIFSCHTESVINNERVPSRVILKELYHANLSGLKFLVLNLACVSGEEIRSLSEILATTKELRCLHIGGIRFENKAQVDLLSRGLDHCLAPKKCRVRTIRFPSIAIPNNNGVHEEGFLDPLLVAISKNQRKRGLDVELNVIEAYTRICGRKSKSLASCQAISKLTHPRTGRGKGQYKLFGLCLHDRHCEIIAENLSLCPSENLNGRTVELRRNPRITSRGYEVLLPLHSRVIVDDCLWKPKMEVEKALDSIGRGRYVDEGKFRSREKWLAWVTELVTGFFIRANRGYRPERDNEHVTYLYCTLRDRPDFICPKGFQKDNWR